MIGVVVVVVVALAGIVVQSETDSAGEETIAQHITIIITHGNHY